MSSNVLKEVVSKAFTISVGRVFQLLIILLVKKNNLVLVLALSLYNFKPLDLVVLQPDMGQAVSTCFEVL